jgi:hypothetical protein
LIPFYFHGFRTLGNGSGVGFAIGELRVLPGREYGGRVKPLKDAGRGVHQVRALGGRAPTEPVPVRGLLLSPGEPREPPNRTAPARGFDPIVRPFPFEQGTNQLSGLGFDRRGLDERTELPKCIDNFLNDVVDRAERLGQLSGHVIQGTKEHGRRRKPVKLEVFLQPVVRDCALPVQPFELL